MPVSNRDDFPDIFQRARALLEERLPQQQQHQEPAVDHHQDELSSHSRLQRLLATRERAKKIIADALEELRGYIEKNSDTKPQCEQFSREREAILKEKAAAEAKLQPYYELMLRDTDREIDEFLEKHGKAVAASVQRRLADIGNAQDYVDELSAEIETLQPSSMVAAMA